MELLTYSEVSKRYGLKVGTLYALVHNHRIPHVRLGARFVRFRSDAIEQWLSESAIPASPTETAGRQVADDPRNERPGGRSTTGRGGRS